MFAGPNGSGKSTIREGILPEHLIGAYVNADQIQLEINSTNALDLTRFQISCEVPWFSNELLRGGLLALGGLIDTTGLKCVGNSLEFGKLRENSYLAAAIADAIRIRLLDLPISFSFETVMSAPQKVELLRKARSLGYRTSLYFLATESPEINVSRVQNRVRRGGHDVPEQKIRDRYYRSLDLLYDAITVSNRAFVWDNSGAPSEQFLVAEFTDGQLVRASPEVPLWFYDRVIQKIPADSVE